LTVGARLNESELSHRLGVSRSPLREAFRALEEAGLVRLEKNRGVFIRDPDVAARAMRKHVQNGLRRALAAHHMDENNEPAQAPA
jgi:DNA-binding GntR family transcriptional regulator